MGPFKKILVLGAKGQVGSGLMAILGGGAVGVDQGESDLAAPHTLPALLEDIQPDAVINAGAYTNVEGAESEQALANVVNGVSPGVMAEWCAPRNVPFVHYSTDYVFAHSMGRPHRESDTVGPLNAYGRSKLDGEQRVAAAGGRYLIFRTSWVYDAVGKNFFRTMAKLGRERESLKVVSDQQGAPTYAPHLADGTMRALLAAAAQERFPSGVYHMCNVGVTTWYEFAQRIFDGLRARGAPLLLKQVEPIATAEYPSVVNRPLDSRLDTDLAAKVLGVRLPSWEAGLSDCLEAFPCT